MSIFKKPFESFRIKYTSVFKFGINFVSPAPAHPEEVRCFCLFLAVLLCLVRLASLHKFYCLFRFCQGDLRKEKTGNLKTKLILRLSYIAFIFLLGRGKNLLKFLLYT